MYDAGSRAAQPDAISIQKRTLAVMYFKRYKTPSLNHHHHTHTPRHIQLWSDISNIVFIYELFFFSDDDGTLTSLASAACCMYKWVNNSRVAHALVGVMRPCECATLYKKNIEKPFSKEPSYFHKVPTYTSRECVAALSYNLKRVSSSA